MKDGDPKKSGYMHGMVVSCLLTLVVWAAWTPVPSQAVSQFEVLAKAKPDECYYQVGNPMNRMFLFDFESVASLSDQCGTAEDIRTDQVRPPRRATAKVNEAYVWGLVKAGEDLWFGTAPNTQCMVMQSYLNVTDGFSAGVYACEFIERTGLPDETKRTDWRPPNMYRYKLNEVDPENRLETVTPDSDLDQIKNTLGIRSAGRLGSEVVILGGPTVANLDPTLGNGDIGINLFAFHVDGTYLGSKFLSEYDDIRKWVTVNGVTYTGVHNTAGGGSVLRWSGQLRYLDEARTQPDLEALFQFEVVGKLDAQAAELAEHEGRLFVTTWPIMDLRQNPDKFLFTSLYMSPVIPRGGLTARHAAGWQKVWSVNRYELDPVTAATYTGGALASYGGYLYWGTMHVPRMATMAHFMAYAAHYPGGPTEAQKNDVASKVERSISIFRGRNLGSLFPQIQLLYGERRLPVYNPLTRKWRTLPTLSGVPRMGPSGFGNHYNNYTWTMLAQDGKLYVGTMDHSSLDPRVSPEDHGADLWCFESNTSKAVLIDEKGLGNISNYGVRTMISGGENVVYIGTANPMNLRNSGETAGGWELIKFTPNPDL